MTSDPHRPAAENKVISVIIPTYNRAEELRLTLPGYLKNRYINRIIVVNDGSTDNTSSVIASFAEKNGMISELRLTGKNGAQKARMAALPQVDTEYILIGEDDVYPAPDYTETLYAQILSCCCDIISGKLHNVKMTENAAIEQYFPMHKTSFGFPADYSPLRIFPPETELSHPVEVPHTHAIALIKSSIFRTVSFDPWYAGNGYREETDFFLSARQAGAKIFFTPDTSCYHLRGTMSKRGGQRVNRTAQEFWAVYNTWHMLKKHWNLVSRDFNLKHGPLFNTLLYTYHREWNNLKKLITREP